MRGSSGTTNYLLFLIILLLCAMMSKNKEEVSKRVPYENTTSIETVKE